MFEKFRVIICFLLLLTSDATLVTVAVSSCSTNGDCPESYYCDEDTCKKCLSCSLLFRTGNPCTVDFIECGDCLPGYEEISITVNSVIKKPCRLVKKKATVSECSMTLNPKSCPPNNYCSEGSCIKCFDCNLVNRLPPANNCAKGLTECGSCRNGYHEVSVTTPTNFKPCVIDNVEGVNRDFVELFKEFTVIGAALMFLLVTFILYILSKRNAKSSSFCAIVPSAPPLEYQGKENTIKMDEIKIKEEEIDYSSLTYVNEQMQQAKVFQQPNAAYYNSDSERPPESSRRNQLLEMDIRRLSLQFGINTIRSLPLLQELNERISETDGSSTAGSNVLYAVPNSTNTGMELVQFDVSEVRIRSTAEQPSEMNVEQEETDDGDTRFDDDAVSKLN